MDDQLRAGSIVALATPFASGDGAIDESAWRDLLAWHADSGTAGVVVAGTTGESATTTAEERDRLLECAVESVGTRLSVIAGTGAASTAVAVRQSCRAASLGASAVLVATPHYIRPPQRGLLAHYRAIADECPVPVILYNVPARTAVDLEPDTVRALAAHPNVVAVKEAVADMSRVENYAARGIAVYSGDDPSALDAMRHGACGVVSVAANVAPKAVARMCAHAAAGEFEAAEKIDTRLQPLYRFLSLEPNPIPVKWMLATLGKMTSDIRLPLVPLDPRHNAAGLELAESLRE